MPIISQGGVGMFGVLCDAEVWGEKAELEERLDRVK